MARTSNTTFKNRELTSVELKKELVRTLKYFDMVCRKNNIKYSLDGGSLIGAVRHKGIIPWDDDVDVNMNTTEFKKFVSAFKKNPDPNFKLFLPGDKGYPYPFAKIVATNTRVEEIGYKTIPDYGVYVDIFVYHFMPANIIKRTLFWWRIRFLMRGITAQYKKTPFSTFGKKQKIAYCFARIFHIDCTKAYIKCFSKLSEKPSKIVCIDWPGYPKKCEFHESKNFKEFIDIEFEGLKAMAIKNYDAVLTRQYGDYMQLPPEEKRKSIHNYRAYYK